VKELMFYLHSDNIDESTEFYRALGFDVAADRIDGIGDRHVRLRHDRTGHFLIALENRPELLRNFSQDNIAGQPPTSDGVDVSY
jgi:hypothetical protein